MMRKTNELFGKVIVAQASGERLATVRDVILDRDGRKVVALLIDSGGWFSRAKVVLWKEVISAGDVIIVHGSDSITAVEQNSELTDLLHHTPRMTGTTLITEGGQQIGTVGDLFINERGEVVGYEVKQGFISDLGGRKFLPVDTVQAIGEDAIIAKDAPLSSVAEATREGSGPGARSE